MSINKPYSFLIDYISKNPNDTYDTGLNGRSAICLFMFEFYRLTSNTEAYNTGIELLEDELNEINQVKSTSLYNGLCGIGLTIQYLSKENFIEIDADNFLPQLMEEALKKVITININFTSYHQLELSNDILFYFAYRFLNTKKKKLKNDYENIINQILIIYNHQFYQIESYKYHLDSSLQSLFPFIKCLLYLMEINFISPLILSLLDKALKWVKQDTIQNITEFQSISLKKAFRHLNKSKSHNFASSLLHDKKIIPNNLNDGPITNMGVWNSGYIQNVFKSNNIENIKKDPIFRYILEWN